MLEYVILTTILLAGLYTIQHYIQRGYQGQMRKTGEPFGFTRQFNPGASRDCAYDSDLNLSYSTECFNNTVNCKTQTADTYQNCMDAAKTACGNGCR